MNALLIVSSYHHHNTRKVAAAMADVLSADVVTPGETDVSTLASYDLIGFGSGIYSARHHAALLRLAETLPVQEGKKAFIFSTDGAPRFIMKDDAMLKRKMQTDHAALRTILQGKGYSIVGEFNCAGFNTNLFLKYFGGLNKGRPNAQDLAEAADFARELT